MVSYSTGNKTSGYTAATPWRQPTSKTLWNVKVVFSP